MMQLFVVGLNHQTAPVRLRERVTFNAEQTKEALRRLNGRALLDEAAILSTCNRSEIYGVAAAEGDLSLALQAFVCEFHAIDPGQINPCFYSFVNAQAVSHLFRVTSSLDSMVLGEPHILRQVREAFLLALESQTTGIVLNHLFQKAAQVGKRVRTETEIGWRPVSVSSVAVELATHIFGHLHDRQVFVVGAGEMSQQTVRHLATHGAKNIMVTNRSSDRAVTLARQCGGRAVAWEAFRNHLGDQDIIISSVQTEQPVVRQDMIADIMRARQHRPLCLIDLGMPRNIDPQTQDIYNVFLYNLDDLQTIAANNAQARKKAMPNAERIVQEQVHQFMQWQASLSAVATIKHLRREAERIRAEEFQAHLRKLGSLSAHQQNIITAMSHAIVNKLLHTPTVRLKHTSAKQHVDALRYLFDLQANE
jgi:glutamyl-tRNA reductase